MTAVTESAAIAGLPPRPPLTKRIGRLIRKHPTAVVGFLVLLTMSLLAIFAYWLTPDPLRLNPIVRLKPPGFSGPLGSVGPFGTDFLGRDLFARVIHGGQISLVVGLSSLLGIAVAAGQRLAVAARTRAAAVASSQVVFRCVRTASSQSGCKSTALLASSSAHSFAGLRKRTGSGSPS